ncbi:MAG TPA: SpoIID/LytB domain-containing protein [Pyrinomonadaceae bacterium]|nr:SpoIID/LytB domain-containing protein [Pyrinomonadaceae bacterium]
MLSAAFVSLSGSTPNAILTTKTNRVDDYVDAALQQAATAALGQREGAIIVMDPQTGRVRAVVNPKIAFTEAVMPGSTMKPFTALAALRSGLIDTNSRTVCPGRFIGLSFSVACVHDNKLPPFSPSQAIAYSCNYYFGTLGERLGRDKLIDTLRTFGFGQPTALSDERGTLLPCEAGNNARIRSAAKGQADCNAREAIGESDHFTVTPIQLLAAYAALVNGGRLLEPRVANANGFDPAERGRVDIAPQHRAIITEGMLGAIRYGTAKSAHLDSVSLSIIGKTGTSLPAKGFRTNGWFVGFASPARGPVSRESEPAPAEVDLAVLIFLPRSHGSEAAAVSKSIFEAYANETNSVHRRDAEERRGSAESKSSIRNSQSAIRVHLVTENVTQELALEDYVLGVMRAEGSMESEPEALKALAIAIRTFALKNLGRHAKDGYDFCTTTHCQRFIPARDRGTSPTVREGSLLAAVRATDGQVLLDGRGQLVESYFGASCGGETANIAALWGTKPSQYLAGVRDEYCLAGPHATWTDVIARADLQRALQSDARTNVGARLDQIIISKRDETGRAEFITLEGEHRKQVRGWDFKIIVGRVLGWNVLKSSRFEVARAGPNFIFRGSGFGHGLGLCQEGAHVMAARGSNYQRILEKYFPGTQLRRDAETRGRGDAVSLKFIREERHVGARTWEADLFMGAQRNPRVPASPRPRVAASADPRVPASPRPRVSVLSSEHFRVTYPADVDRRDADLVLNTLESARSDFLHRASAASLSTDVPPLEIRINASTGDFTVRTGQPWWAAAATKANRIELQPVGVLKRRGSLTTTLRHELAHVLIDAVSHNRAPRWLGEGFAIYLAREGPMLARYATKTKLSPDEIEKRLERPGSQQEMRALYALAYNQVLDLIRSGSEASVWKKLAAS